MNLQDIKLYDFAWMRQGIHLASPRPDHMALTHPQRLDKGDKSRSALLMLHGFASSAAVFRLMAPHLRHYDHIFIPNLAGHGLSIASFAQSNAQSWLKHAEQACSNLHAQFESVDVLGLSLGGLIACHLVKKYPLRNLFLLAPALALIQNLAQLRQMTLVCKHLGFENLLNRGGRTFAPFVDELLYRQLPLTCILELLNFIDNYQFHAWDTPSYLFLGQHDNVVDSKKVHQLLKSLPRLEVSYLPHSSHVLAIDGDYQHIIERINVYSSI